MIRKPSSIYKRIIIFISILSIVPVLTIGLYSFFKSSNAIEDYVSKEKENSVYQIETNFEQILKTVDHSLNQLTTSYQIIQALREPMEAEQFRLYNLLREELSNQQTFDTRLADVSLISFPNGWLINNYGLQRLDHIQIHDLHEKYLSLKTPSTWILEDSDDAVYKKTATGKSCPVNLSLVKKIPLTSSNKTGVVVANIPVCSFEDIIKERSVTDSMFVLNSNGQVIISSHPRKNSIPFEDSDIVERLEETDKEKGQFRTKIDDVTYQVTYRKSDYNGWTYLSLVELSELRQQTMAISWLTLFITILLVFIALIISMAGSKHFYRPVKRVKDIISNALADKEEEDTEDQDELEYIESQVKYMLKQNVTLEKTLQNQISQLKQFFVSRLLEGRVNEEELPSKLKYFGFPMEYKRMAVLSIQIDSFEGYKRKEEDVLLLVINNMVEELVPPDERLTPVVKNQTQVTMIVSNHDTKEDYIYHMNYIANLIQQKVKEEYNLPISLGISEPFTDFKNAKTAYKESLEALKYTLKYGEESIIFFENLERGTGLHTHFPKNVENDLFDAIKINDDERVDALLDELLDAIFTENLTHAQYQISIVRFLNDLIELMQTLAIDVLELSDNKPLFEKIYDLKTKAEVKEWFMTAIIDPLMKKLEHRSESQYKTISENIVHIIQSEFDTDLTLDIIAARLHYNPNYLSSIFRKEMNISFSEYLSMYRINMAKQWLVETELSIKEISNRLNYNNPQNFIRSFKKAEGITPGKYREKWRGI